ncbi:hypothetical protein ABH926_008456 [Catenulispora sp. GP43]
MPLAADIGTPKTRSILFAGIESAVRGMSTIAIRATSRPAKISASCGREVS